MSSYVLFFVLLVAMVITNGRCDDEATAVALETSGLLLAPQSLVHKIADDLKAIRTAYPQVSNVVHSPPWALGEVIAKVSDAQLARISPEYGQVTASTLFGETKLLKFTQNYNPVVLAEELTKKGLVVSADPDFVIGGADSIQYNDQTGVYEFKHGSRDCPSGCINRQYWTFSVSASGVTLVSESGTPPVGSDEVNVYY